MSQKALSFLELRPSNGEEYINARSLDFCEACGFWQSGGQVLSQSKCFVCSSCEKRMTTEGNYLSQVKQKIERVEFALREKRFLLVTAAIIYDGAGKCLLAEREHSAHGEAAWEFPGGKVEAHESLAECLVREIEEELALQIAEPKPFFMVDHVYETFDIRLCSFETTISAGNLSLREHRDVEWVERDRLLTQNLSGADIEIARAINSR